MKDIRQFTRACLLSLPLLVGAQLPGPFSAASEAPPRQSPVNDLRGRSGPPSPSPVSPSVALGTSLLPLMQSTSPTSLSVSATGIATSASGFTTTNTIDVSSFMAMSSSTSFPSTASTTPAAFAVTSTGTTSSANPDTSAPSSSPHPADERRTIIIVLSTVLGLFGLLSIAAAILLAYRRRRGLSPFGHRSATPLDDEEIESWRGAAMEKIQRPQPVQPEMLSRPGNSVQLTHSPGWTWTESPTSVRSAPSPLTPICDMPAFLAKAPNSRAGLTDETVPGEDPFLPPTKRQSSRLSKAPPGHARSKSRRRSSTSAKSVRGCNVGIGSTSGSRGTADNMPSCFTPEDWAGGKELCRAGRTTNSSPETSIFDSRSGGLSPRPRSQPRPWEWEKEIGLAIT